MYMYRKSSTALAAVMTMILAVPGVETDLDMVLSTKSVDKCMDKIVYPSQ